MKYDDIDDEDGISKEGSDFLEPGHPELFEDINDLNDDEFWPHVFDWDEDLDDEF